MSKKKAAADDAKTGGSSSGSFTHVHAFGRDSIPPQKIDYHHLATTAKEPRPHRESIIRFVATAFHTK